MRQRARVFMGLLCCGVLLPAAYGENWPTYRHDNRRSGVTSETPQLPLKLAWERTAKVPPTPAWTGPAPWDAFSGNKDLQPQRDFDSAFYTTHADGLLYFGSSVDHCVHAIDPASGEPQWVFFTEGAVRLPPTIDRGKAFFGSDDGYVYCVNAKQGTLLWRLRGGPSDTRIPCDGKLLSLWPCRTGMLIDRGQAYCAFSLVPWKESLLYSLNTKDGGVTYRKATQGNTFQGPLAAGEQLVLMQGKAPPIAFDAKEGNLAKTYAAASGVRCTLTGKGHLIVGPSNQKNRDRLVLVLDRDSGKPLARFSGTDRLLVDGAIGYLHRDGRLAAINLERQIGLTVEQAELAAQQATLKKSSAKEAIKEQLAAIARQLEMVRDAIPATVRWELTIAAPCDLIKAGSILFVGTPGAVTAVDTTSGRSVWTANVKGRACGMTFADGRLFVSTDLGHICAFEPAPAGQ